MTGPPQTPDWLGPEVQALALRLWNIGFQVEAAKKIAAALVAHPTRGYDAVGDHRRRHHPVGPPARRQGGAMIEPYRVLVTGSRTWEDDGMVRQALRAAWVEAKGRPLVVVHGHCKSGADAAADVWGTKMAATYNDITVERHPARWRKPDGTRDRGAGWRRNAEMVAAGADLLLAFIKAESRGATHCLKLAEKAGIPTQTWRAP